MKRIDLYRKRVAELTTILDKHVYEMNNMVLTGNDKQDEKSIRKNRERIQDVLLRRAAFKSKIEYMEQM